MNGFDPRCRGSLARTALAALACLVVSGSVPAWSQAFRVVGFGDSVTHAVGFDVGGSSRCNAGKPDTCGYTTRLAGAKYYDCGKSNCQFVNRGLPGELTSQGLTRLDKVLAERPWDLVILMEGTNDISGGVSPQSVAFNLRRMAAKVKKRNMSAALASAIWLNPSVPRELTSARNQNGSNLSNLLAVEANRSRQCFVDTRSQLCPAGASQAACFAKNYWKPTGGQVDFVGHPNARGYDLIAKEFFSTLGSRGAPGAVEITSPSGQLCGKKANLVWRKETKARTSCGNWFRVEISGAGGNKLDAWYHEDDLCSGSECRLVSPVNFDQGTYSLRIRNRNTRGYGPWTQDESFTIVATSPRKVGKLFGPSGEFFSNGGLDREFSWKPVSNADSYRLELVSNSEGVLFDGSFDGAGTCDATTCTATLEGDLLPTGEYSWRVLAENVCGGGWSAPESFVVFDGPPAVAPVTYVPGRQVFDATPTFRWEPVVGATEYEVEDAFGTLHTLPAAEHCVGGICRFASAALAVGSHSWRVRGVNSLGPGSWSPAVTFEVADCDCFEGQAAGGSTFLLAVPDDWNGNLVIWNHPSNYFGVKETRDFGPLAQRQFDEGYALATTSFSVTGWPLFRSNRDLEKVYRTFVARHGAPEEVFLVGESTGALAALAAVQKAKLGKVVGALAVCGPVAGSSNWAAVLDQRLAYDAICSKVVGAAIPGGPKGLPRPHDLEPVDVRSAVNICTGVGLKPVQRSPEQKMRLRDLLAVNSIPEKGLQEAMLQATFGLYDLVRDSKKLKGRLPVGNEGVDYGSATLNDAIARVAADRKSAAKLGRFFDLSGNTKDARVLSLHTTQDPVFFVENQQELVELAPEASLALGILDEAKASHCGYEEVELLAAWRALETWAGGGRKPKAKNLQSRCRGLRSEAKGACRFKKRPRLGRLETRIRPRS